MPSMPNSHNHVDDCARVHVLALDPGVKDNSRFIMSSTGKDGTALEQTKAIVNIWFPEAVERGVLHPQKCGGWGGLSDGGVGT